MTPMDALLFVCCALARVSSVFQCSSHPPVRAKPLSVIFALSTPLLNCSSVPFPLSVSLSSSVSHRSLHGSSPTMHFPALSDAFGSVGSPKSVGQQRIFINVPPPAHVVDAHHCYRTHVADPVCDASFGVPCRQFCTRTMADAKAAAAPMDEDTRAENEDKDGNGNGDGDGNRDDDVVVLDNDQLRHLLSASPLRLPPLRELVVNRVPDCGATLGEVLCTRRVLSLSVWTPIGIAAEPLALPPRASANDLLVTRLAITLDDESAKSSAAEPMGALLTAFPSMTSLSSSYHGRDGVSPLCVAPVALIHLLFPE
jgi:hypothetical protein